MAEYLNEYGKDLIGDYNWQEMLSTGNPIDLLLLSHFLSQANYYLITEPGPNREQRAAAAHDWLGWWREHLRDGKKNRASLVPISEVASIIEGGGPAGVLFMGGGEGHSGHRFAVERMSLVRPVLLFEQDEYLKAKKREKPFLPLEVRLSMWSYFKPGLVISVTPEKAVGVSEKEHYQAVFDATGADYCFVTEGDPNQEEKRARGKQSPITLIPRVDTPSTTLRVQKLFPD